MRFRAARASEADGDMGTTLLTLTV
jgi:hypothetical protein